MSETVEIITILGSLIVAALVVVVGTKMMTGLTGAELDIITDQTTRAITSIIVNLATVEQGVRQFDLKKNFAYELNETHVRLTFIEQTHTLADESGMIHSFAMPHYQKNVINSENTAGTERICISKRIIECKPQITICDAGEECCDIKQNSCKYVTQ